MYTGRVKNKHSILFGLYLCPLTTISHPPERVICLVHPALTLGGVKWAPIYNSTCYSFFFLCPGSGEG